MTTREREDVLRMYSTAATIWARNSTRVTRLFLFGSIKVLSLSASCIYYTYTIWPYSTEIAFTFVPNFFFWPSTCALLFFFSLFFLGFPSSFVVVVVIRVFDGLGASPFIVVVVSYGNVKL